MRRVGPLPSAFVIVAGAALSAGQASAQGSPQGVTKDEIVLGMHADLSGPAASFSVGVVNALRMKLDEANGSGGINGRKVRLIVEDTSYQVPKAIQAANKLINRDKIFAMVGGTGTPQNNAVLPDQLKAGVPNLFPMSWARSMSEPFNPLKFALNASYADQIRQGIKYMVTKHGKKTPCIMYQDTDFGQEIYDAAKVQVEELGLKFAEATTHKPTDQDYTAQIAKLRAAKCDFIAMGTIVRDTIIPYSTIRKMGWDDVELIGTSASYDLAISGAQGGITEGYYSSGFFDAPYPDTQKPAVAKWVAEYKARFNVEPTIQAAIGNSMGDLLIMGLKNAGADLTADTLVKGLEKIGTYQDIFGGPPQSFSATKHVSSTGSVIYKVEKGRWIRVPDAAVN